MAMVYSMDTLDSPEKINPNREFLIGIFGWITMTRYHNLDFFRLGFAVYLRLEQDLPCWRIARDDNDDIAIYVGTTSIPDKELLIQGLHQLLGNHSAVDISNPNPENVVIGLRNDLQEARDSRDDLYRGIIEADGGDSSIEMDSYDSKAYRSARS